MTLSLFALAGLARLLGLDFVAHERHLLDPVRVLGGERASRDAQRQDGQRDDERAGPGQLLPILVRAQRKLEDHGRQARYRLEELRAEELIVQRGEQKRRGFAADARDGEQHAGDQAGSDGAIADPLDHQRTRHAERGAGLAQRVGNQVQHVFGRPNHDRNHQDRQRDRAGDGREMTHRRHDDLVNEKADHDRRGAEQDVVDEADDHRRASNSGRIRPGRCPPACRAACRRRRR